MDWFKMQTVWGAGVERLSDAEAGRFIKALYAFVRDGTEYAGSSGREDTITWQALETLRKDVEAFKKEEANQKDKEERISQARKEAADKRWKKQKDANGCKAMQNDAFASTSTICNAFASENKNKNIDNIYNYNNARAEMPFGLTDEDIQVSLERDQQIEDTAKGAGLNTSEISMVTARRYADEYGLEKLLDAIRKTALNASKPSWAYVEGVLKGKGAKQNDGRGNNSGVQGTSGEKPSKYAHLFDDAV